MAFTKEERAARARAAGLKSAAKRREKAQAALDAQAMPTPPAAKAEPFGFEDAEPVYIGQDYGLTPATNDTGDIAAPVLSHDRIHPEPNAAPVPERPINWGAGGRVAARTLAEAMAETPPEALEVQPDLEVQDLGEEDASSVVLGTDVGGGTVYLEMGDTFPLTDVIRAFTTDIPGPGDRLVSYKGRKGVWLQKKGS